MDEERKRREKEEGRRAGGREGERKGSGTIPPYLK